MKVLQVIDRLNVGGAEKVYLNLITLLKDKGLDVDALIFNTGFPLDGKVDKRVKLHVLNRKNKFSIATLYKAHRICSGYDIVQVHMRHVYAYIRLTQVLFGGKYKLILHDHYGNIELDRKIPVQLFFKPEYYIGVSRQLTQWALDSLHLNADSVFLLSNTIIPTGSYISNAANSNKVLMIANIRETKNIEFAIELCRQAGLVLTVYGNKTDEDYYNKINNLLGESCFDLKEGVTDFAGVYNNYGLAIHTAVSETGPLVLLEYMAAGMPFIAYKTGEVAEVAAKRLPAHFASSFDIEKWRVKIDVIRNAPNVGEELRTVFQQNFGNDKYVKECLNIYKAIHS